MLKIALCDDDMYLLNELGSLLERYRAERGEEIACRAFQNPLELLEEMEGGLEPDILFLDVVMPGVNGIGVAREIRENNSAVKIIFLTSAPEFAVDSYTVGAYAYQVKPLCAQKLFALMDDLVQDCRREQQSIVVHAKSGIARIQLERLEYCEVIGRELRFVMMDGRVYESSGSMEKLWGELERHGSFIRPHRSFLVNMKYIQTISGRKITMQHGAEIPIPHGKCTKIREQFLAYAFDSERAFVL